MAAIVEATGIKALKEIDLAFKALGIEYFLIQGTCLGAYRDKRIIRGDGDMDFGVKHEIMKEKCLALANILGQSGYAYKFEDKPFPYSRAIHASKEWPGGGKIRIDICDFVLNEKSRERFCVNYRRNYCIVHPAGWFENMQEIDFYGLKVKVPTPIEGYLIREYGGTWKVPDPTCTTSKSRVYGYWGRYEVGNGKH